MCSIMGHSPPLVTYMAATLQHDMHSVCDTERATFTCRQLVGPLTPAGAMHLSNLSNQD